MKNYRHIGYYSVIATSLLWLGTAAADQTRWQPYGYIKLDLARRQCRI